MDPVSPSASASSSAGRTAPSTSRGTVAWRLHPPVAASQVNELVRTAGIRPLVAELLLRRGIAQAEDAHRFLEPSLEYLHDPFLLKGMDEAVRVLCEALSTGARIVVSGDYDVDGITSSALLTDFLRRAGASNLATFVPNRFDHGYGLTTRTVEALMALRAAVVTTVITDHHLPRTEGVPAGIVVNPLQPGCPYPFKRISGCGVTFKLVTALRKRLRDAGWWNTARPEPNLKDWLDLVAI